MSLPNFSIPPLDPNLYTAQVRTLGGPARTGSITFDEGFTNSTTPSGVYEYARWIYVGATGNLNYRKWDGTTETLRNIAAGIWHPIFATAILSAGTTIPASDLRWGS